VKCSSIGDVDGLNVVFTILHIIKNSNLLSNKDFKSTFIKLLVLNDTTTNQLHIHGFNNWFYV
jgi:hypothetical protein